MAYWKMITKTEDLKEHNENPLIINDEIQKPEIVCDCCGKDLYDDNNDKCSVLVERLDGKIEFMERICESCYKEWRNQFCGLLKRKDVI